MFQVNRVALAMLCFVGVMLLLPEEAEAKKMIFYHKGPEAFETGPLPEPFDKDKDLAGLKAGYKCDTFGLFFAHISISNCQAIAFREMGNEIQFMDESNAPELIAAIKKKYSEGDMKMNPWAKYGKFILGLVILAAIGGFVMAKVKGEDDDDEDGEA